MVNKVKLFFRTAEPPQDPLYPLIPGGIYPRIIAIHGCALNHQFQEFKMISIIGRRAKIIDMRKKSCFYVGLRKFKDTVSNRLSLANPIDLVFAYANMGLKAPVDLELEMAPSATWVDVGLVFRN